MADVAQLESALIKADAAGDTEGARVLAAEVRKMRAATPSASGPMAANAGLAKLGTSIAGLPVDTIENVLNLGRAGVGIVATAAGRPDLAPNLQRGSVGGSQWLEDRLRSTGMPGLSPDNPSPQDPLKTAQYNFVARGGVVPGGALPAAASMAAEKLGGPQWAPVGAMAPAAAAGAIGAMRPAPNPNVQALAKEGVPLTPGAIAGGTVKRLEDAATSVPVLGDSIRAAQRRGVESLGTAGLNRALQPIGEKLPGGLTGNKAVDYTYGKLGDAYDALLPKLKGSLDSKPQNGTSLREDLKSISASQDLPEPQRGMLDRVINKEIIGRFENGVASGEKLKAMESQLGMLAKSFRNSDNYDVRNMGEAVKDAQAAIRQMVERENPAYQGELSKINDGYANFKIVQKAASNPAAVEGVFSPAQLHSAVRAKDLSKDKARFAEGNARMQDLSSAGKAVLPSSVPDSGTPMRAALMYAMAHPLHAALLAPPVAAGAAAYSPLGQGIMQRVMMGDRAPQNQPMTLAQMAMIAGQSR